MDNFDKYHGMYKEGYQPQEVYLIAQNDNLDFGACIRILRQVFNLSLIDAKETMIIADKLGTSLMDYQEKFVPILQRLFDEYEDELDKENKGETKPF